MAEVFHPTRASATVTHFGGTRPAGSLRRLVTLRCPHGAGGKSVGSNAQGSTPWGKDACAPLSRVPLTRALSNRHRAAGLPASLGHSRPQRSKSAPQTRRSKARSDLLLPSSSPCLETGSRRLSSFHCPHSTTGGVLSQGQAPVPARAPARKSAGGGRGESREERRPVVLIPFLIFLASQPPERGPASADARSSSPV
jgi:hypothetical protein